MSMILDALRKSDRERTRQARERLRDGPAPARSPAGSRWIGGGVAAALLVGAAAAMLLWQQPVSRVATGANPEIMENDAVDPAPGKPALPAGAVRDLGAELGQPEPVSTAVAVANPPAAPSTRSTLSVEELTAPPLATLPKDFRNRLPVLEVNAHAWAENPEARFVLINLRRYGEGDRLQEGPRLRRILQDGVVLEFQGRLFSLPRS